MRLQKAEFKPSFSNYWYLPSTKVPPNLYFCLFFIFFNIDFLSPPSPPSLSSSGCSSSVSRVIALAISKFVDVTGDTKLLINLLKSIHTTITNKSASAAVKKYIPSPPLPLSPFLLPSHATLSQVRTPISFSLVCDYGKKTFCKLFSLPLSLPSLTQTIF